MIAGRCSRTTISPDDRADAEPGDSDRRGAAGDAERPGHRGRRDDRAEADQSRRSARLMPPVSIRIACAIATSASGNQLWANFDDAADA